MSVALRCPLHGRELEAARSRSTGRPYQACTAQPPERPCPYVYWDEDLAAGPPPACALHGTICAVRRDPASGNRKHFVCVQPDNPCGHVQWCERGAEERPLAGGPDAPAAPSATTDPPPVRDPPTRKGPGPRGAQNESHRDAGAAASEPLPAAAARAPEERQVRRPSPFDGQSERQLREELRRVHDLRAVASKLPDGGARLRVKEEQLRDALQNLTIAAAERPPPRGPDAPAATATEKRDESLPAAPSVRTPAALPAGREVVPGGTRVLDAGSSLPPPPPPRVSYRRRRGRARRPGLARAPKTRVCLSAAQVADLYRDLGGAPRGDDRRSASDAGQPAGLVERVAGVRTPLLPHQLEGLRWMQSRELADPAGGILGDEMGLGKTLQAVALAVTDRVSSAPSAVGPTLVVCPLAVVSVWLEQLAEHLDPSIGARVQTFHGAAAAAAAAVDPRAAFVVTTYDTVWRDCAAHPDRDGGLRAVAWRRIVLDEGHSIRNWRTRRAEAVFSLDAQRRWFLSGTPVQNSLDDLYSAFHFLRRDGAQSLEAWRRLSRDRAGSSGEAAGSGLARVRAMLGATMLRRTKDGRGPDGRPLVSLPPRTVTVRRVQLSADERRTYDRLAESTRRAVEKGGSYAAALVALVRLRQACCHSALLVGDGDGGSDGGGGSGGAPSGTSAADDVDDLARGLEAMDLSAPSASCTVCDEALDPQVEATATLPCGHAFCRACLLGRWLEVAAGARPCRDEGGDDDANSQEPDPDSDADSSDSGPESPAPGSRRGRCPVCRRPCSEAELEVRGGPDETVADCGGGGGGGGGASSSSKFRACFEELRRQRDESPSTKSVVFSQWTRLLDLLEAPLAAEGFRFSRLDGSQTLSARTEAVWKFRTDPDVSVMLVSLRAGGVGLNLTAASQVIMLDSWWNPAVEEQAYDRVHRLGQTRPTRVCRLVAADTVEERVLEMQRHKSRLADGALADKTGRAGQPTLAQLRELFQCAAVR